MAPRSKWQASYTQRHMSQTYEIFMRAYIWEGIFALKLFCGKCWAGSGSSSSPLQSSVIEPSHLSSIISWPSRQGNMKVREAFLWIRRFNILFLELATSTFVEVLCTATLNHEEPCEYFPVNISLWIFPCEYFPVKISLWISPCE
jgi:hypothetical protein